MSSDRISRERTIRARPADIFAVLTDIDQHRAIDGSDTLRGQAEGPRPLVLGSVFTMAMHQVLGYRTRNTVVEYEPDRLVAWETRSHLGPLSIGGHRWRYELAPDGEDTRVTETLDWGTAPWWFGRPLSRVGYFTHFGPAIEATLKRLATHVERTA